MSSAFHVAPSAARAAIAQLGLFPNQPRPRWARYDLLEQPAGVYVWDSLERAVRWALDFARLVQSPDLGANDIWCVDVADLALYVDPVLGSQGAKYFADHIPGRRLQLVRAVA